MCILVGCEACFLSHHKKGQNSYFSDFPVGSIGHLAPAQGIPCSHTGLVTQESRTRELGLCVSTGAQALAVPVKWQRCFLLPTSGPGLLPASLPALPPVHQSLALHNPGYSGTQLNSFQTQIHEYEFCVLQLNVTMDTDINDGVYEKSKSYLSPTYT